MTNTFYGKTCTVKIHNKKHALGNYANVDFKILHYKT